MSDVVSHGGDNRNVTFPGYEKQLGRLPRSPELLDFIQMLTVLSQEAGDRVKHRDGAAFRAQVLTAAEEASDLFNEMTEAQMTGDVARYNSVIGKFSGALSSLAVLAEEGVDDIEEEAMFFKRTVEVCKRVESMEGLKTQRMSVMSEGAVMKLVESIPVVLAKYLSPKVASAAYAELLEKFKMPQ